MDPEEKCGKCKYFVGKSEQGNSGECHRYAPRPSPRPKMQIEGKDLWADTQWPKVGVNVCCGEFEPK
jgi:hypothetical protein